MAVLVVAIGGIASGARLREASFGRRCTRRGQSADADSVCAKTPLKAVCAGRAFGLGDGPHGLAPVGAPCSPSTASQTRDTLLTRLADRHRPAGQKASGISPGYEKAECGDERGRDHQRRSRAERDLAGLGFAESSRHPFRGVPDGASGNAESTAVRYKHQCNTSWNVSVVPTTHAKPASSSATATKAAVSGARTANEQHPPRRLPLHVLLSSELQSRLVTIATTIAASRGSRRGGCRASSRRRRGCNSARAMCRQLLRASPCCCGILPIRQRLI